MALFEARGLHKRFGHQVVLEEIVLAFEAGSLSGIMGPNGAGKTTCFNVLTGRYKPDRGTVRFDGEDITGLAPHRIVARGISRSFQIMNLFEEYTALDNVVIALPQVRARGFSVTCALDADTAAHDRAEILLERVGLKGRERTNVRSLSRSEEHPSELQSLMRISYAVICLKKKNK